jgi:hypothetical protein
VASSIYNSPPPVLASIIIALLKYARDEFKALNSPRTAVVEDQATAPPPAVKEGDMLSAAGSSELVEADGQQEA